MKLDFEIVLPKLISLVINGAKLVRKVGRAMATAVRRQWKRGNDENGPMRSKLYDTGTSAKSVKFEAKRGKDYGVIKVGGGRHGGYRSDPGRTYDKFKDRGGQRSVDYVINSQLKKQRELRGDAGASRPVSAGEHVIKAMTQAQIKEIERQGKNGEMTLLQQLKRL